MRAASAHASTGLTFTEFPISSQEAERRVARGELLLEVVTLQAAGGGGQGQKRSYLEHKD